MMMTLPLDPLRLCTYLLLGLSDTEDDAQIANFTKIMKEDPEMLILAILPVTDVFVRANPIYLAKSVSHCRLQNDSSFCN